MILISRGEVRKAVALCAGEDEEEVDKVLARKEVTFHNEPKSR